MLWQKLGFLWSLLLFEFLGECSELIQKCGVHRDIGMRRGTVIGGTGGCLDSGGRRVWGGMRMSVLRGNWGLERLRRVLQTPAPHPHAL